jgi:carbon storage regulator CsrA
MLVLSTRLNDKILLPDSKTTIEIVAIQSGTVRLGITAPEDVRILREGVPDRVAEWGPDPADEDQAVTLQNIRKLIDKRLEIAREGINQARQCLRNGQDEDARVLMEKIDEDLHLLRRRVRREVEKAESPCGLGI